MEVGSIATNLAASGKFNPLATAYWISVSDWPINFVHPRNCIIELHFPFFCQGRWVVHNRETKGVSSNK